MTYEGTAGTGAVHSPLWLPLLLAAVVAGPVAAPGYPGIQVLRNLRVGDPFPAFSVQSLDGTPLSRSNLDGRATLILFVRPGQERSVQALRTAQRIREGTRDTRFLLFAVSTRNDAAESLKKLAAAEGLAFPIALDPGKQLYGDLGIIVTPTFLLLDGKGVLRFEIPSTPPGYEHELRVHLDLLLGRLTPEEHAKLMKGKTRQDPEEKTLQRQLALARTLLKKGQYAAALSVLEECKTSGGKKMESAVLRAQAFLALDRTEEASSTLAPFEGSPELSEEFRITLARIELHRKDTARARAILEPILDDERADPEALYLLGRIYESQRHMDKAVTCYRRALETLYGALL